MVLGKILASESEHSCAFKELHDWEQMMQREVKSCDLKAAAIKTCLHKYVKTHQSLCFCWSKNPLAYSVGHKRNGEARLTARDRCCANGFQVGADYAQTTQTVGKSSSACTCMSVHVPCAQKSLWSKEVCGPVEREICNSLRWRDRGNATWQSHC